MASEVVQLPFREGGLGLRSAARLAPAAYWASWADCLSQVHARAPHVCAQLLEELEGPPSRAQCVREAQDAATLLARRHGSASVVQIPCHQWTHGWQFLASVARDTLFATSVHRCPQTTELHGHRDDVLVLRATSAVCPLVRRPFFSAEEFRTLLLVRLHLPSTWTHVSASAGNCWTCMVTTDQHVHVVGLLKPRGR